jgi:putative peptide zinc metalloprotease protein
MDVKSKIPVLSTNIEILPFDKDEFIIKQTEYGHRINVNKDTLDIIKLVDGKRNLEKINELYGVHNGASANLLDNLLFGTLATYGIIESANVEIKKIGKPTYLKLSFTLIRSRSALPIVRLITPLFSGKLFYFLLSVFSLVVFGTLIVHFDSVKIGLENLSFSQWVLYFLFAGAVLFFHEMGHAAACHRFGAKFGDIGFGFYLLSPVMYADVSDIWKLKSDKRVIVNLSGIYIELLIATILVLIFYITRTNDYLVFSSAISLSLLANLNPFLRYDGYWVLSDMIGVPNLRMTSNMILKNFFRNEASIRRLRGKDLFLLFYALTSQILILIVLGGIVLFDTNGIIDFPKNIFIYLSEIFAGRSRSQFTDLYRFILPVIFYFTVFNFVFSYIKNRQRKIGRS